MRALAVSTVAAYLPSYFNSASIRLFCASTTSQLARFLRPLGVLGHSASVVGDATTQSGQAASPSCRPGRRPTYHIDAAYCYTVPRCVVCLSVLPSRRPGRRPTYHIDAAYCYTVLTLRGLSCLSLCPPVCLADRRTTALMRPVATQFHVAWSVCLFVCLSVCLSVCLYTSCRPPSDVPLPTLAH